MISRLQRPSAVRRSHVGLGPGVDSHAGDEDSGFAMLCGAAPLRASVLRRSGLSPAVTSSALKRYLASELYPPCEPLPAHKVLDTQESFIDHG